MPLLGTDDGCQWLSLMVEGTRRSITSPGVKGELKDSIMPFLASFQRQTISILSLYAALKRMAWPRLFTEACSNEAVHNALGQSVTRALLYTIAR
jgi:hypothetical protein